jgi:CheY-like chemotaxis protein
MAMEKLVGGIAHDLNNLSTAIATSVQTISMLLENEPEKSPFRDRLLEYLETIERATHQSSSLVTALAAYTRDEANTTEQPLREVVVDTAQFLRRALSTPIESSVPKTMRPRMVLADLGQLARALVHLCDRGARSGARLRLAATDDREITLEINLTLDQGASAQPLDEDVEAAQAILARCGAMLALSFADGRGGWTASIRLPAATPTAIPTEVFGSARSTARHSGRALVAEDNAQVRGALVDALTRCDLSVETVADGDALVQRAMESANEFDLLFVDFDLPGRNGEMALEALREAGIDTAALMISGNVDFRPRVATLRNTDFLQKPFGLADVRNWVAKRLSEASQEEEAR